MKFVTLLYTAGRARKGPAPVSFIVYCRFVADCTHFLLSQLNLEIPPYSFLEADAKLIIG